MMKLEIHDRIGRVAGAALVVFAASFGGATAAFASDPTLVSQTTTSEQGGIERTEMIFQDGANPLNSFSVLRIRGVVDEDLRGPVLLLSPFNVDSRHYELTPTGKYKDSFLGNLAKKGFDVWSLSDRVNTLPIGSCAPDGAVDCTVMQSWTMATRVEDAAFVRGLIAAEWPSTDPVIGGTTGGGMAAIATVNTHPGDYAGLFSSGSMFSLDPAVAAHNAPTCAQFQFLLGAGAYFFDGFSGFAPIVSLARHFPDDPSPIPDFTGLSNHQVLVLLLSTPGGLGPNSLTPSYVFAAGDVVNDQFFFMSHELLFQDFDLFGTYVSVAGFADISCGLAGDSTHVADLDAFAGPVILFGGGQAFGPLVEDVATLLSGAATVDVFVDPPRGEGDRYLADDRERLLDKELIDWLKSVF